MDPDTSALLLKLIRSEIELAHVFVASGRTAYRLGYRQDGDTAHEKAEAAYSRALNITGEIPEAQRQLVLAELERLKTSLDWLSLRVPESMPAQSSKSIRPDDACAVQKTAGQKSMAAGAG
jgi:hypothetical protein